MRGWILLLASLLLAVPAKADLYQDASNAKLPWHLTTENSAALSGGINIVSGYAGTIGNADPSRWWGMQVQYGQDDCAAHMYKFFRPIRWFAYGTASCATIPAGSTGSYLTPGLFSLQAHTASAALVSQGVAMADGVDVWGINTLKIDAPNTGDSTAASIGGTTLTVGGTVWGSFNVGDSVSISGGTALGISPGSYITQQLTGSPGGAGTYKLNFPSTYATGPITARAYRYGALVQDEYDNFCFYNESRCRNIIVGHFPNGEQSNVHGATVGGTIAAGNQLNLTVTDGLVAGSPRAVSYTIAGGDTANTAATGLAQAINSDANLQAAGYLARAAGALVRVHYPTNNGIFARPTTVGFAQSTTGGATLTLGLLINSADQRFALGTSTFDGKWQNAFQSASGTADFALSVGLGTRASPPGITQRSQALKFYYTDNTSATAARVMTMYADPTLAGTTGVDFILGNNSGQNTNLRLVSGGIWMSGNLVTETPVGNTHIMRTTVNNPNDTELWFEKARGGGAPAVISAGDALGSIRFRGYDGTAYVDGVSIGAASTSVVAGNVEGFFQLYTNGSERLRITNTMTRFGPPAQSAGLKPTFGRLQTRSNDDATFAFMQAKLQTDTNYTAGVPVATGYLTLYDAAGTAYKVPACTAC